MKNRDARVYEEAAALWRELHGRAPPPGLDGPALLGLITSGLEPQTYTRLNSPHLRDGALKWSKV
jgi:hypothetical protein